MVTIEVTIVIFSYFYRNLFIGTTEEGGKKYMSFFLLITRGCHPPSYFLYLQHGMNRVIYGQFPTCITVDFEICGLLHLLPASRAWDFLRFVRKHLLTSFEIIWSAISEEIQHFVQQFSFLWNVVVCGAIPVTFIS